MIHHERITVASLKPLFAGLVIPLVAGNVSWLLAAAFPSGSNFAQIGMSMGLVGMTAGLLVKMGCMSFDRRLDTGLYLFGGATACVVLWGIKG